MKIILAICVALLPFNLFGQWSASGDSNRGTQLYSSGGALGYSIRTSSGGGWAWQFVDASNNSYLHVQWPSGSVGIGTTSPSNAQGWERVLDVRGGNSDAKIIASSANASYITGMYSHASWNGGGGFIGTETNHNLFLITNYSPKVVLTPGGYMGIGLSTPSPSSKLHINSAVERETFRLYRDGNTTNYLSFFQGVSGAAIDPIGTGRLYLGYDQATDVYMGNATGKVGIGTTGPAAKLDVNGNFQISPSGNAGASGSLKLRIIPGTSSTIFQANSDAVWANHDIVINGESTSGLNSNQLVVHRNGGVGVGTADPGSYKLAVEGKIGAREVNVTTTAWSDYVFNADYKLRPLAEVQQFIEENHHLPDVPSEKEVLANGQNLGEMNAILLKKIEELTLYVISLKEENEQQQRQINELNALKKVK